MKDYFLQNPPEGVEVIDKGDSVILRSEKFKGVRFDDGRLYILIDDDLAKEFQKNPFVAIIQSLRGKDTRILISNYKAVNVKCPFCGHAGKYYLGMNPLYSPHHLQIKIKR